MPATTNYPAPGTVDLNIIGSCNLRCPFCWGPPHDQGALLDAGQWQALIERLGAHGTRSIVLTGGEPLLHRGLPTICRAAKAADMHLTLSTNGALLPALGPQILPHIDEIGIPLDGATDAENKLMRVAPGQRSHFQAAVAAIRCVVASGKQMELTIRTVVSRRNAHAVMAIGDLIEQIDWPALRWKLYRFVPIGYGAAVKSDFWIEQDCFNTIVAQMRWAYPGLHIDTLDHAEREGRYLHILPNGDAITPTAQHNEIALGNALHDLDGVLASLAGRLKPAHNGQHGQLLAAHALGA